MATYNKEAGYPLRFGSSFKVVGNSCKSTEQIKIPTLYRMGICTCLSLIYKSEVPTFKTTKNKRNKRFFSINNIFLPHKGRKDTAKITKNNLNQKQFKKKCFRMDQKQKKSKKLKPEKAQR